MDIVFAFALPRGHLTLLIGTIACFRRLGCTRQNVIVAAMNGLA
jgi:hypothetical protein